LDLFRGGYDLQLVLHVFMNDFRHPLSTRSDGLQLWQAAEKQVSKSRAPNILYAALLDSTFLAPRSLASAASASARFSATC
jgi:hypothetical protein